jgi:DUF438 domain-containing protein
MGGFIRTKTILGRKIQFCHPPRLERYVIVEDLTEVVNNPDEIKKKIIVL